MAPLKKLMITLFLTLSCAATIETLPLEPNGLYAAGKPIQACFKFASDGGDD